MLNIYQWYYKNIWPLKNKSILLNYKDWKVLVKAPVGTGKSFLFFDWLIYGLYKYSDRTIINKDSKKAEIQVLFSVEDDFYLIIRKISITKTWKDSTKSEFYSIVKDKNFIDYLTIFSNEKIILNDKNNIFTILKFHQVQLNNLTTEFKLERELQENLNDLLPPKDVSLSTIFLPQNSENIFEMEPSNRINILKKVFGIMWIDDAKKIIDNKKKEVVWEIKWRENIENFKNNFNEIIDKITNISNNIKDDTLNNYLIDNIIWDKDFKLDIEKIQKIDFNISNLIENNKKNIEQILLKNEKYKQTKQTFKQLEEQLIILKDQKVKINNILEWEKKFKLDLDNDKKELENFEKEKHQIEKNLKNIKDEFINIQKDYENYIILTNKLKQINTQEQDFKDNLENIDKKNNIISKKKETILNELKIINPQKLSQDLVLLEKELKIISNLNFSEYSFENKKVKNLKELEKLIDEIKINWKNLKEQLDKEKANKLDLLSEIENLDKQIENSKKNVFFKCSKIGWNCPFIDKISQQLFWENNYFTEQKKKINLKLVKTDKNIKFLEDKLHYLREYWKNKNISKVMANIVKYDDIQNQIWDINKLLQKNQSKQEELANINWQLEQLKQAFFKTNSQFDKLKWEKKSILEEINTKKNIKQVYMVYTKYTEDIWKITEQITLLNKSIANKQSKVKEIIKFTWQLEEIDKQIMNLDKEKWDVLFQIEKIQNELKNTDIDLLKDREKALTQMKELFWIFNNLVDEFNKNKLQVIELKKKFLLLKELANIFWKELVIYVFSDYISSLESLINYFITDLVNFKLNIHLDEKWEKLEIFAEDELWKRDIKSLSGWQKTALRIGWILWISKLQNSKLLFLDETINNFDQEAVQIIAKKIKEFTEENKMKFYMITHSEILQQTDIWTDVVELNLW